MTLPKFEAGSMAAPASVRHQFDDTQDLAKTKSVRSAGDGHSSLGMYIGTGTEGLFHAAHEAPPFGSEPPMGLRNKGSSESAFFILSYCLAICQVKEHVDDYLYRSI